MKSRLALVVLFVVLMVLIDDSDAWRRRRIRIRIRGRRLVKNLGKILCNSVCGTTCITSCPNCAPVCGYGCKKICNGKRDADEGADSGEFILRLPCKFDTWDTNNDGSVSLEEFAFAGHTDAGDATKTVFNKVDYDGDGKISQNELDNSSLLREDC